jgi:lysozyme
MSPRAALPFAALVAIVGLAAACSSSPGDAVCSDDGSALKVCAGKNTVSGIDVSYYQGTIDWAAVKKSGRAFAITRVSDGTGFIDPKFATNWKGIKANGLIRGTYQFFHPGQEPIAQADVVLAQLKANGGLAADDLPIVMDMETTDGASPATIQANMKKWLTYVEQKTGKKPIIYTAAFMSGNVGTGFTAYPLWVANYGTTCPTMPSNWTKWVMWQSSSTGSVPGIAGNVDVDEFNGTLQDLKDFINPPPPEPPPTKDAGTTPVDAGGSSDAAAPKPDAGGATLDAGAPDPCNP